MEQTSDRFLIRKASVEDISRIAEILVFVKRMNYRVIFKNDAVSFGEIQVIPVAKQYSQPEILESIWVYDAPGMNLEISRSEGFLRIREKIRSYIPQTSIIGLLMDYYEPYTVVRADASGISQHEPLCWQVYGPRFETLSSVDRTAEVVRDTLHEWLQNSTPEQRAAFVDTLFRLVETTKATKMSDLIGEKLKSMLTMVGNRKEVDPETRRVFSRLMAQAVTLGFGNVIDRVRGRKSEAEEVSWTTMTHEKLREAMAVRMDRPPEAADGGKAEEQEQAQKEQIDP